MQIFRNLTDVEFDKNTVLTLGTFDGVHLGHQQIINAVVSKAKQNGMRNFVLTFDPHPRKVLSKDDKMYLLSSIDERVQIFEALDVENLLVVNFTKEFSKLSPIDFIEKYLIYGIGLSEIVIGHDHHFGKSRDGNVEILRSIGKEKNFLTTVIPSYSLEDRIINSTKVRNALMEGDVALAAQMLGRLYKFTGTVKGGDNRGKELGYPTANIEMESKEKLLPLIGIYAVNILLRDRVYNGLLSIGKRPTFYIDGEVVSEVYIFDFDKQIYGEKITIELIERIRSEEKFNSKEELIAQMDKDREKGKRIFKNINN